MKQWWRAGVMLLSVGFVLAGCATQGPVRLYEGPERKPAELVQVTLPEQVEIMTVDGHEPPSSFLQRNLTVTLLPGEHVLSLRYVELFQINAEEHEVVRSRQAALRFTAAAGSVFRIDVPKQANLAAAKKFAKEPAFHLVNAGDGSTTDSTAIRSYGEASLLDTISNSFESAKVAQPATNLDLLKDVWGRSTSGERQAFRAWLDEQGRQAP